MSINVLSLFDGMSCGQIALNKAGILYDKYYASEIDKYAIKVTQANYPNTIQLGDVTNWKNWDINWSNIDLIIGGSPCTGFSCIGKHLAFEDPQSKLFFEFLDIVNYAKKYNKNVKFLLENVRMKKEYLQTISDLLGVKHVYINSSLVSAQLRSRCYWANWHFCQPIDKKIKLEDIIENGCVDRDKSYCLTVSGTSPYLKDYLLKARNQLVFNWPAFLIENKKDFHKLLKENIDKIKKKHYRKLTPLECERLQTVPENYTNHVSKTQRYKMLGNGWTIDVIVHILKPLKNIFKEANHR